MNSLRSSRTLQLADVLDCVTVLNLCFLLFETSFQCVCVPTNSIDNRNSVDLALCLIYVISLEVYRTFWISHALAMDSDSDFVSAHLLYHLNYQHQCHAHWYATMLNYHLGYCQSDYHYTHNRRSAGIHDRTAPHRCQLFPIQTNSDHRIDVRLTEYSKIAIYYYCYGNKNPAISFAFHKKCAMHFSMWDRTFGRRASSEFGSYLRIYGPYKCNWYVSVDPFCSKSIDDRKGKVNMCCSRCLASYGLHRSAKTAVYCEH